jgi:hypothetical protein
LFLELPNQTKDETITNYTTQLTATQTTTTTTTTTTTRALAPQQR